PADAVAANVTVYRTVRTNPPTSGDFTTYHELGKQVRPGFECRSASVSVFLNVNDARHHRDVLGWKENARLIAAGRLTADHGVMKQTPGRFPSHVSWWPYVGVDRSAAFQVVTGV